MFNHLNDVLYIGIENGMWTIGDVTYDAAFITIKWNNNYYFVESDSIIITDHPKFPKPKVIDGVLENWAGNSKDPHLVVCGIPRETILYDALVRPLNVEPKILPWITEKTTFEMMIFSCAQNFKDVVNNIHNLESNGLVTVKRLTENTSYFYATLITNDKTILEKITLNWSSVCIIDNPDYIQGFEKGYSAAMNETPYQ